MRSDELPALPTGCHLRGGVFHLRVGIPDDIRHLYPRTRNGTLPSDAFRGSLRTATGILQSPGRTRRSPNCAGSLRTVGPRCVPRHAPPLVPLTPELERFVVAQASRIPLAFDDVLRNYSGAVDAVMPPIKFLTANDPEPRGTPGPVVDHDGLTEVQHYRLQQIQKAMARSIAKDMAMGRLQSVRRDAEAACATLGVRMDWTSPDSHPTLIKILREQARAWQQAAARGDGEIVDTPEVPTPPVFQGATAPPAEPKKTLRDVVPEWKARNRPKDDAVRRTQKALALFEEAVGTVPLPALDRRTGARFVASCWTPQSGASPTARHTTMPRASMP